MYRALEYELQARLLVEGGKWCSSKKIAFLNGTLDLERNVFSKKSQPSAYLTSVLPFEYREDADCPKWQKFLEEATNKNQGLIQLLQAICKWVLMPKELDRKAEIEKAFDLIGQPATGKSTFLDVLIQLVGFENVGPASPTTFKDAVGLGDLIDKKLAVDADCTGKMSNPGLFNKVVSNEPVVVKRLYQDTHSLRLGVVVVRAYNSFLETSAGSQGFDRRVVVIPFEQKPKQTNLGLGAALREELPQIFYWAWSLDPKEMRRRIETANDINAIAKTQIERQEANNPVLIFLKDQYPTGSTERIKAGEFYSKYKKWCEQGNFQTLSLNSFVLDARRLGCERSPKTNGNYYYTIPALEDAENLEGADGVDSPNTGSQKSTTLDQHVQEVTQIPTGVDLDAQHYVDPDESSPVEEEELKKLLDNLD
ncbi:MAG TPA: phage/plasmid primase, P4 family [Trichocoleus sp.]